MSYTVFHLHTDLSNPNGYFDSCSQYQEYIDLAKEDGMKAIAFSEHGVIYEWINKKIACDKADIKYIHGVEAYICDRLEHDTRGYHLGMYARNWEGVLELNTLVSLSSKKGIKEDNTDRQFYYHPRLSLRQIMNTSDNIIITTACLASIIWRERYKHVSTRLLKWMAKNKHRCFLEIQYHNHPDQIEHNKNLYRYSKKFGIPLIAGSDTHSSSDYKAECRKILQKSNGSFYGDEDTFNMTWKTYEQLYKSFLEQNCLPKDVILEAINNTNVFADMVEPFELDREFKYPNLYGDKDVETWGNVIVDKFLDKKERGVLDLTNLDKYKSQIKEEFDSMKNQGMASFMLFMSELIDHCKANGIPVGDCRGSVGGSLIAFITDITQVDPIKWGTVFSRFCNADRISLADIDLDFAPDDRQKVFDFIIEKFGIEHISYISQFGKLKDRGTIDVLGRGLDYEDLSLVALIKDKYELYYSEYFELIKHSVDLESIPEEYKSIEFDHVDYYVTKMVDEGDRNKATSIKSKFDELKEDNKELFYYFDGLKGTIVTKGVHPAGIIGSPITITDNLSVFYKDGDEGFPVSSCSMKQVDYLNFVKYDILSLKSLGVLRDTYKYIGMSYPEAHEINWNDQEVWKDMITSNIGVFQFESKFAGELLARFKPKVVNDMSLVNACLRPSGKSYRERLINREFNVNPSKEIDELLKNDLGYLVYQESTIKFLTDICGFTGSEADSCRRFIAKGYIEKLEEMLPKILDGYCSKSSKPREITEQEAKQFIQMISDSSAYQFGLNHSTGYSMIGYRSALARYYYTIAFITSYLNNATNKEDIQNGTKLAHERGIKVKNISFRNSVSDYTFDKDTKTIHKGIASIKYCNSQIAEELYAIRDMQFNSFIELVKYIKENTSVDSRQVKILTKLNFFDEFGKNKKLLQIIDMFEKIGTRKQIKKAEIDELSREYNIMEYMISKYSKKETPKLYKEVDMISLIQKASESIEDKSLSIQEQIKEEMEYLEYVSTIIPEMKDFLFVKEFKVYKNTSRPYLLLHDISNGEDFRTKVTNENNFDAKPFDQGDIIMNPMFKEKEKIRKIDNKWVKTGLMERILEDWSTIK
jgi:DNA polymerase-3 subunit alpha